MIIKHITKKQKQRQRQISSILTRHDKHDIARELVVSYSSIYFSADKILLCDHLEPPKTFCINLIIHQVQFIIK